MKCTVCLLFHLLSTLAKLIRPGGSRAVIASQVAAARYTPGVARFLVVVLIACSIALMGGTTCHVSTSSGTSKKDDGKSSSQTVRYF